MYLTGPDIAKPLFNASVKLHEILGIRISTSRDHVIPPTRVLLALGIVLDFDLAVIYMPAGKLDKLRALIEETKRKEVIHRVDLQRILGVLNHWAEVIPAGKVFVNRLLKGFKEMSQSQDYFRPSDGFRKDLRWWERVAPHLNYDAMMVPRLLGPPESIEMDASQKWGIGAVSHITREFFQVPTPKVLEGLPIHCAEMAALMLVIDFHTLASEVRRRKVRAASVVSSHP